MRCTSQFLSAFYFLSLLSLEFVPFRLLFPFKTYADISSCFSMCLAPFVDPIQVLALIRYSPSGQVNCQIKWTPSVSIASRFFLAYTFTFYCFIGSLFCPSLPYFLYTNRPTGGVALVLYPLCFVPWTRPSLLALSPPSVSLFPPEVQTWPLWDFFGLDYMTVGSHLYYVNLLPCSTASSFLVPYDFLHPRWGFSVKASSVSRLAPRSYQDPSPFVRKLFRFSTDLLFYPPPKWTSSRPFLASQHYVKD